MLRALATFPQPVRWHDWFANVYAPELDQPTQQTRNGQPVPIHKWANAVGDRPLGVGLVLHAIKDALVGEGRIARRWDATVEDYRYGLAPSLVRAFMKPPQSPAKVKG